MNRLSYQTLEQIGYSGYLKKDAPEKVLQFGEGNFLRAFADYFLDCANERADWNGKVVLVQPIEEGLTEVVNEQEGLYTLYSRGQSNGEKIDERRVISVVSRCLNPYREFEQVIESVISKDLELIISNTTEAGIVYDPDSSFEQNPPLSFPAKLTRLLYERFKAGRSGIVVLSCELIDDNGRELLRCVEKHIEDWKLGEDFADWIREENLFCSTLVDRIVPGRIKDPKEIQRLEEENRYEDRLTDVCESFGIWIIEGPKELEYHLPFQKAGLNVKIVEDVTPYKQRKVRILNGAHTGFALGAYLAGKEIVRDCMENDIIRSFMNRMIDKEIIPTLTLDKESSEAFAATVSDRFNNPFINHRLLDISLNSTSKWKARNLPSLLAYVEKTGSVPKCLMVSLASYIAFYSSNIVRLGEGKLTCRRSDGKEYSVCDEQWVLDFFYERRTASAESLATDVLSNVRMWGCDLTEIRNLQKTVIAALKLIREKGALHAYASCLT